LVKQSTTNNASLFSALHFVAGVEAKPAGFILFPVNPFSSLAGKNSEASFK